ncbi:MAG: hypothetical protein HF978_07970 [Desulfobacteraceae bacterium]|nr:nitroreductase family protein [Desulfobacteraceae bacterium]MBC2755466.1 hypothetical protein [Desulfobacteraceae bacterium]
MGPVFYIFFQLFSHLSWSDPNPQPGTEPAEPALETGEDLITWGAPALLLFHADKGAECHTENIHIDLAYGILAAHAMGLGATPIGLVSPAVEMTPELRKIFEIPNGNEVLSSMIVGYPKHSYQRTIKRRIRTNIISM